MANKRFGNRYNFYAQHFDLEAKQKKKVLVVK